MTASPSPSYSSRTRSPFSLSMCSFQFGQRSNSTFHVSRARMKSLFQHLGGRAIDGRGRDERRFGILNELAPDLFQPRLLLTATPRHQLGNVIVGDRSQGLRSAEIFRFFARPLLIRDSQTKIFSRIVVYKSGGGDGCPKFNRSRYRVHNKLRRNSPLDFWFCSVWIHILSSRPGSPCTI